MNVVGGSVRRKRRKRGGQLIGGRSTWTPAYLSRRKPGSGLAEWMFNPLGAAVRGVVSASGYRPRSRFGGIAQRIARRVGAKRGSGMSIHGAGMSIHGAGLRGKRVLPRQGRGKRMI